MKIINFKKKKKRSYQQINRRTPIKPQKSAIFVKQKFEDKHATDKGYHKVRDHCHYTGGYRGAAYSICKLKHSVPKEIPTVFHK